MTHRKPSVRFWSAAGMTAVALAGSMYFFGQAGAVFSGEIAPADSPTPTLTFIASPASIQSGQSSTLSWSSTNATSCTASGAWSGTQPISGSQQVTPTVTSTYTLACTGAGGSISQSATVTVAAQTQTGAAHGRATLNGQPWSGSVVIDSHNGEGCVSYPFPSDYPGVAAGSYTVTYCSGGPAGASFSNVTPSATQTLVAGGDITWTFNFTSTSPPTLTLTASPASIQSGQSSTLSWTSINAASCTASGAWNGSKSTSGSQQVTPTVTGAYTLTCSGTGGTITQSITLAVTSTRSPRIGAYYFGMFTPQGFDSVVIDRINQLYGPARASGQFWWAGVQDFFEHNLTSAMQSQYPVSTTWFSFDWSFLKPAIGWYDQSDSKVLERHINQAISNGISYFNFYWYWDFSSKEFLQQGLDSFLLARNNQQIDFAVAICEHGWNLTMPSSDFQKVADILTAKYFSRPNYLKTAEGKLIVQVCDPSGIRTTIPPNPGAYTSLDIPAVQGFVNTLRTTVRHKLNRELAVIVRMDGTIDSRDAGVFDGGTCIAPILDRNDLITNYGKANQWMSQQASQWSSFMPCLAEGFDERPRLGILKNNPNDIVYFTYHPQPPTVTEFRAALAGVKQWMDARPQDELSRFLTIYAWNEWHEGGRLEPNVRDGASLINQITSVFNVPYVPMNCRTTGLCPDAGGGNTLPTLTLTASPASIQSGQSSTLSWTSINAASCTASGAWSGTKSTSGSQQVTPTTTSTYTLTCSGAGNSVSQTATVAMISSTNNPQYLLIHPQANNELINGTNLKDMIAVLGRGTSYRRLGFILAINGLDDTDQTLVGSRLDKAFQLAESLDVPLLLHIDFENWWNTRPEFWNWWDPNLPGYNPNNRNNVEWSNWTTPTKSRYLDWGTPLTLPPKMCFESTALRQEVRMRSAFIAGKVNAWRARLSDMGKSELFAGIKPTGETGIENSVGSSFVPADAQADLGYCALVARGFGAANPPADRELELARAVKSYSDFEVKTFYDLGIPKEKLYTGIAGSEGFQLPYHARSPLWTALNDYSVAGFSLYPGIYSRSAALSTVAGKDWAITEMPWNEVKSFIDEPNLRLVALYNWDHLNTANGIANNPAAIAAIRSALGTGYQAPQPAQSPQSPAANLPPSSSFVSPVCTQEAKQCPDGSYVSRTGPNCEFAACPSSAPQPAPSPETGFSIPLRLGMQNADVTRLQQFLATDPSLYPEGLVTGYFGQMTMRAVIRFQEKYASDILAPLGLTRGTGIVGPATLRKLNELSGGEGIDDSTSISPIPLSRPATSSSLYIVPASAALKIGESVKITAYYQAQPPCTRERINDCAMPVLPPQDVSASTRFTSSDPSVAVVDEVSGDPLCTYKANCPHFQLNYVRGVASGQATITAVYTNGDQKYTATMQVTVVNPESASIHINSISPASGSVGTTITLIGTGFTKTGNTVKFGTGFVSGLLNSSNSASLSFTLPSAMTICPGGPGMGAPCFLSNVASGQYHVSVQNVNGASNSIPFTVTSADATPSVAVLSPNGGETWQVGSAQTIRWSSNNAPTVMVDLIRPGYECHLTDGDVSNTGSLIFTVSNCVNGLSIFPAADYKIRVMYRNNAAVIVQDDSDAPFSIVALSSFPTVVISASPTAVTSGSASLITWSSTNATSCTASGGWSGTKATSGSQSTGNVTATTTFALACTGAGGSASQSATVSVTGTPPPISGTCDITDLASLKSCFNAVASYDTFNFKNDVSCSDGSCCTNQYGFMQILSASNKTINGNGHTFTRRTNQRACPALKIAFSSNVKVSNLNFDEDEASLACVPNDNCPATIDVHTARSTTFDGVRIYNGKAYVVNVWGSNGFTFANSAISNAGIIGLYIGNSLYATSSNIRISGNVFARARTNALAIEGVDGANIVDHNVFTRNHYFGLWPTPNTAPSYGAPSNGGEVYFSQADNLAFTDNIITDGSCSNCFGAPNVWGVELGDPSGQRVLRAISIARNIFANIFGKVAYLNQGTALGNAVTVANNLIRRVTEPGNLLSSIFYNNTVVDSAQPHNITNNIYRLAGQNLHRESPIPTDPIGTANEGVFGLSASPRLGASDKPLFRCIVTGAQDDFVSSDSVCEGQTVDDILGFSYEPAYPGAKPFYACMAGAGDHFISWASGCEGQSAGKLLGYAVYGNL